MNINITRSNTNRKKLKLRQNTSQAEQNNIQPQIQTEKEIPNSISQNQLSPQNSKRKRTDNYDNNYLVIKKQLPLNINLGDCEDEDNKATFRFNIDENDRGLLSLNMGDNPPRINTRHDFIKYFACTRYTKRFINDQIKKVKEKMQVPQNIKDLSKNLNKIDGQLAAVTRTILELQGKLRKTEEQVANFSDFSDFDHTIQEIYSTTFTKAHSEFITTEKRKVQPLLVRFKKLLQSTQTEKNQLERGREQLITNIQDASSSQLTVEDSLRISSFGPVLAILEQKLKFFEDFLRFFEICNKLCYVIENQEQDMPTTDTWKQDWNIFNAFRLDYDQLAQAQQYGTTLNFIEPLRFLEESLRNFVNGSYTTLAK